MPSDPHPLRRLAVLIDADNVRPDIAEGLFARIDKIGEASVRRAYGDFFSPHLKPWVSALQRHGIAPRQQFPLRMGKNAADIALVIEAMDLLHGGRFDGFCLVSSDCDFTPLASRIREEGIVVLGFGEKKKTPESFQQACHAFIDTGKFVPRPAVSSPSRGPTPTAPVPVGAAQANPVSASPPQGAMFPLSAAASILRMVIAQMEREDGGWVRLTALGAQLRIHDPGFRCQNYGAATLSSLVRKTGGFDLDPPEGGPERIRIKPIPEAKPKPAKQKGIAA